VSNPIELPGESTPPLIVVLPTMPLPPSVPPGKPRDKGMGDADSLSVTRYGAGSTIRSKSWSTPPTPQS
jgi:hypothetical protein